MPPRHMYCACFSYGINALLDSSESFSLCSRIVIIASGSYPNISAFASAVPAIGTVTIPRGSTIAGQPASKLVWYTVLFYLFSRASS